ncbi:MAG: hypothetical protein JW795_15850 [Chitinivibrionales bacterium]|nr:hypothetical protein [Chitinivibrionales bacterium]
MKMVLESNNRFSLLYRGKLSPRIVILGNSRGVHSFYGPDIARSTGSEVLNLSYNGFSTEMCEAILSDYLEKNEKPSLIIVELSNLATGSDVITDLKMYSLVSERITGMLRKYKRTLSFMCAISNLYYFNTELFLRNLYFMKHTDQTWIQRNSIGSTLVHHIDEMNDFHMVALKSNLVSLVHINTMAQNHSIPIRYIITPYFPDYYFKKVVGFDRYIEDIQCVLGYEEIVWCYPTAITEHDKFADLQHSNYEGSKLLLSRLIKDGFFNGQQKYPPCDRFTRVKKKRGEERLFSLRK